MRKPLMILILCMAIAAIATACSQEKPAADERLVRVEGGTFKDTKSNYYGTEMTLPTSTSVNMRSPSKNGWK